MKVSKKQFEDMTEVLLGDVWATQQYYELFWALNQDMKSHLGTMNQTPTFWRLTMDSLFQTTIFRLCRIYDKTPTSFNLAEWIRAAKDSKDVLKYGDKLDVKRDRKVIKSDISQVCEGNKLVKHLIEQRNKCIAHHDLKNILNDVDHAQLYPLTFGEVRELIDRAFKMLNKYSITLTGLEYDESKNVSDYKRVLEAQAAHNEAKLKARADEMKKYGLS